MYCRARARCAARIGASVGRRPTSARDAATSSTATVARCCRDSRDTLLAVRTRPSSSGRTSAAVPACPFAATHGALFDRFGHWPIFEHCLPFDVARLWDELDGIDWPRIWTSERGALARRLRVALGHGSP
jgi:hypothetical protein